MAVILTIALTACATYVNRVKGFTDAVTFMNGETNIRTEATMTFKFTENARPMTFSEFLKAIQNDSDIERLMTRTEFGISLALEVYDDTFELIIGWYNGGQPEILMSIIFVDDTIYISTELIDYVFEMFADELEAFGTLLSMFSVDYISLDLDSELLEMLDLEDVFGAAAMDAETEAFMLAANDKLADVMREYIPKLLTEDMLSADGRTYTLTLNAETTIQLLKDILNLVAVNESAIKEFIRELGEVMEIEEYALRELDELNFTEFVLEGLKALDDLVIGEDLPDFDLVYTVTGTGRNAEKAQTSAFAFVMNLKDFDADPIDALFFDLNSVTTISKGRIAAPSGNIISVEDIVAMVEDMLGDFGGGLFGMGSGDSGYDWGWDDINWPECDCEYWGECEECENFWDEFNAIWDD
jgi:hypothetical protein